MSARMARKVLLVLLCFGLIMAASAVLDVHGWRFVVGGSLFAASGFIQGELWK